MDKMKVGIVLLSVHVMILTTVASIWIEVEDTLDEMMMEHAWMALHQ